MKKVATLLLTVLLVLFSIVSVNAENPIRINHTHQWTLFQIIDHGAYGFYYYMVNSCPYVSYSHQHFLNRYLDEYVYICAVCGEERREYQYSVGWDEPDSCTLHDWGKKR